MGIPMDDDIHTPTVPSGPTSARAEGRDLSKLTLNELFQEKDRLEVELKVLGDVLQSVRIYGKYIPAVSFRFLTFESPSAWGDHVNSLDHV